MIMHDIWNPWHGCRKYSTGCANCYAEYLDKQYGSQKHFSDIFKTKNFDYPIQKKRDGSYKIKSGELIRINMASDTFLEEADEWRYDMWKMIKIRSDVAFIIITKRANRIIDCLPKDWGGGYENVFLNVTTENQEKADERIPILKEVPAKHKGIMVTPMLEEIHIEKYLSEHFIELVTCGGENYDGPRKCCYEWVQSLSKQCEEFCTNLIFMETGTNFWKDGKQYLIKSKKNQAAQAYASGESKKFYDINFNLVDMYGNPLKEDNKYVKQYNKNTCIHCPSIENCNGCSKCGKCENPILVSRKDIDNIKKQEMANRI